MESRLACTKSLAYFAKSATRYTRDVIICHNLPFRVQIWMDASFRRFQ